MRGPDIPRGSLLVRTYDEYEDDFVGKFLDNKLNLLVIIGRPALGKSHRFKEAAKKRLVTLCEGKHSVITAYMLAYRSARKNSLR